MTWWQDMGREKEIVLTLARRDWGDRHRYGETSAESAEKGSYLCEGGLGDSVILCLHMCENFLEASCGEHSRPSDMDGSEYNSAQASPEVLPAFLPDSWAHAWPLSLGVPDWVS